MKEELTRILKDLVYATGGNSDSREETSGIEIAIEGIIAIFEPPPKKRDILK